MTTKAKPAPAKPAAKKSTSTALTIWEQEMQGAAVEQASTEKNTGSYKSISTKGGILSVDDNPVDGNELRVIILASIHENQYYIGDYDASNPASPVCYAFGKNDDEMTPHEESPDKQADLCAVCWANEWASADKGKGKACKNVRRLLVITEDALEDPEALKEAEMRMMKLPVMSVKNWTTYVNTTLAEDIKRPSYGVVTRIKLVPDAKSQFRVQFHFEELVDFDAELYDIMKKRVAEAEKNIVSAYPVFEEEEKPQRGGRRVVPIKPVKSTGKAPPAPAAKKGRGKF